MSFIIDVINGSQKKYIKKNGIINALQNVFDGEKITQAKVSVILTDNDEITRLNEKYLQHEGVTDVISFNLSEEELEGEVYICVDVAVRQAEEYKVSFNNELMRLAVHGTLHILGYDDINDIDRTAMHELENIYIENC